MRTKIARHVYQQVNRSSRARTIARSTKKVRTTRFKLHFGPCVNVSNCIAAHHGPTISFTEVKKRQCNFSGGDGRILDRRIRGNELIT